METDRARTQSSQGSLTVVPVRARGDLKWNNDEGNRNLEVVA